MNRGYTLVELLIAMTILTIVTLGFFAWSSTVIQTNLNTRKNNVAYAMALDIAEKLKKVPDTSTLIQPVTQKCAGFVSSDGSLKKCTSCTGGSPGGNINFDAQDSSLKYTGYTEYTDFWDQINFYLYMYDGNYCKDKNWLDATNCRNNIVIQPAANPQIDHPSSLTDTYDVINPVRYINNTTYYAVWSILYLSCNGNTDRRKIFVTVYWIDPEPEDTSIGDIQTHIKNGIYTLKSVSVTTDRTIGIKE